MGGGALAAGIEVAAEVAALVDEVDRQVLARRAAARYDCLVCGRRGRVPDDPAALVLLRGGQLMAARLAHASCSASAVVDVPAGVLAVLAQLDEHEVTAVASVLPDASGARPVIIVEFHDTVSSRSATGDRIDKVVSALLANGLHLIERIGPTPPQVEGWRVDIDDAPLGAAAYVQISDRAGVSLYDGQLILPGAWLQLAVQLRSCLLLVGTALHLDEGLGSVADGLTRLNGAALAGRLVGAAVAFSCGGSRN